MINLKQFLYIDLFIIIPVAVSSKSPRCEPRSLLICPISGSDAPFPENLSQATDRQSCVEESSGQFIWTGCYYKWSTTVHIYLGSTSRMVSRKMDKLCYRANYEFIGIRHHHGITLIARIST